MGLDSNAKPGTQVRLTPLALRPTQATNWRHQFWAFVWTAGTQRGALLSAAWRLPRSQGQACYFHAASDAMHSAKVAPLTSSAVAAAPATPTSLAAAGAPLEPAACIPRSGTGAVPPPTAALGRAAHAHGTHAAAAHRTQAAAGQGTHGSGAHVVPSRAAALLAACTAHTWQLVDAASAAAPGDRVLCALAPVVGLFPLVLVVYVSAPSRFHIFHVWGPKSTRRSNPPFWSCRSTQTPSTPHRSGTSLLPKRNHLCTPPPSASQRRPEPL